MFSSSQDQFCWIHSASLLSSEQSFTEWMIFAFCGHCPFWITAAELLHNIPWRKKHLNFVESSTWLHWVTASPRICITVILSCVEISSVQDWVGSNIRCDSLGSKCNRKWGNPILSTQPPACLVPPCCCLASAFFIAFREGMFLPINRIRASFTKYQNQWPFRLQQLKRFLSLSFATVNGLFSLVLYLFCKDSRRLFPAWCLLVFCVQDD